MLIVYIIFTCLFAIFVLIEIRARFFKKSCSHTSMDMYANVENKKTILICVKCKTIIYINNFQY